MGALACKRGSPPFDSNSCLRLASCASSSEPCPAAACAPRGQVGGSWPLEDARPCQAGRGWLACGATAAAGRGCSASWSGLPGWLPSAAGGGCSSAGAGLGLCMRRRRGRWGGEPQRGRLGSWEVMCPVVPHLAVPAAGVPAAVPAAGLHCCRRRCCQRLRSIWCRGSGPGRPGFARMLLVSRPCDGQASMRSGLQMDSHCGTAHARSLPAACRLDLSSLLSVLRVMASIRSQSKLSPRMPRAACATSKCLLDAAQNRALQAPGWCWVIDSQSP